MHAAGLTAVLSVAFAFLCTHRDSIDWFAGARMDQC